MGKHAGFVRPGRAAACLAALIVVPVSGGCFGGPGILSTETEEDAALRERRRRGAAIVRAYDENWRRRQELRARVGEICLRHLEACEAAGSQCETLNADEELTGLREEIAILDGRLALDEEAIELLKEVGIPTDSYLVRGYRWESRWKSVEPIEVGVVAVQREGGLVTLSAGADKGVRKGHRFTVYRGEGYVGKVEVVEVADETSTARILVGWTKQEIRAGDDASTRLY